MVSLCLDFLYESLLQKKQLLHLDTLKYPTGVVSLGWRTQRIVCTQKAETEKNIIEIITRYKKKKKALCIFSLLVDPVCAYVFCTISKYKTRAQIND